MKHALSQRTAEALSQLAAKHVLLAFDFDGTLAPIVAHRDHAVMRGRTRALLGALCKLYPCAVISGRARRDVAGRLDSVGVKHIVGNHGIEPGSDLSVFADQVGIVRPMLAQALATLHGVEIEDKRYSLSVHYRRAPDHAHARAAIDRAVAALPCVMRVIPGKLVANVLPSAARNKGEILLELREREGADVAVYVGDDVTDEDVFVLDQPGRLFSMRVGKTMRSAAPYFLRDQHEIDRLLTLMLSARKGRSPR